MTKNSLFLLNISFVLISIFSLRQSSTTSFKENSFKCTLDGLFEDENDCRMYYECLWIGTAFEKQEHIRCADKLIYNPRKHRCDDINEFEGQFANGVQTGEELLEFMRFRNCVGFKNLLDESLLTTTTETTIEYTSPPNDYYPQVLNHTNDDEDNLDGKMFQNDEINMRPIPPVRIIEQTTTFTIPTTSTFKIEDALSTFSASTRLLQFDEPTHKTRLSHKSKISKSKSKHSKSTTTLSSSITQKPINLIKINTTESNSTGTKSISNNKQPFQTLYLVQDERIFIGKKSISSSSHNIMNNKHLNEKVVHRPKGVSLKASNQEYKVYVRKPALDTSLESLSIINNSNNVTDRSVVVLHPRISSSLNNKIILDKELNNKSNDFRATMPAFRGRKLLSIDMVEEENAINGNLVDDETTTTVDDEEIDSKDSKLPDKDEVLHEFTNQIMKNFNQNINNKKMIKLNETTTATSTTTTVIIDNIEQRLSKRGKTDNSTSFIPITTVDRNSHHYNNKKPKLKKLNRMNLNESINSLVDQDKNLLNKIQAKLIYGYLRNSTIPSMIVSKLFENDSNNPIMSAVKKPIQLVKLLPKLNQSIIEDKLDSLLNENAKKKLDKLLENYLNEIKANKSYSALTKELEIDELKILNYLNTTSTHNNVNPEDLTEFVEPINPSLFKSQKISITKSIEQSPSSTKTISSPSNPTKTTKKLTSKKPISNKTLDTTFIPITTFRPVKTLNSKPYLQTYRINQTKKIPNQFASLKLNYDRNSITKIDEVERGGKFQRLRIIPTDTLIECKENDFGLECSCSITLSPPKCKQLINSFLSSCRILGCKNGGRCINMAYKYPIPYVCSCPGAFMGTYCEIPRDDFVENDMSNNASVKSDRFSNKVTAATKYTTLRTSSVMINPFLIKNEISTTKKIEINQFSNNNEAYFKEPVCEPNPCQNRGRCAVVSDSFVCKCLNSSYSGKYCEIFKLPESKVIKLDKTPLESSTSSTSATNPYLVYSNSNNDYYPLSRSESSTRRYFWQCPSNCNFHLNHGYCALSQSGFPSCVCRNEFTGIDCSQSNYCLNNRCSNNSTCFNYPEMKSYLCICQKGFTGRTCDIDLRMTLGIANQRSFVKNLIAEPSSKNVEPDENLNNKSISTSTSVSTTTILTTSKLQRHPCLNEKCKNNGTCIMTFSNAKNKFNFACKCSQGFTGEFCELRENPCLSNPCKAPTTECIPLGNQKYECVCGNGEDCLQTTTSTKAIGKTPDKENKKSSVGGRMFIDEKNKTKKYDNKSKIASNQNINPCNNDPNLCLKYPYGNESFICVKSFISQDYTLCLPTKSMNCKESNPCLNGGVCFENNSDDDVDKPAWKCVCPKGFTGNLCETEICSPVHRLFANHTMCQPDSPNLENIDGVVKEDMELILDVHNTLRRQVAPLASNMQKMYWDVRLQHLAQKRSHLCSVDNTGILMRQQPGYGIVIGENLAAGYEKWADVLSSWMSEKKNFIYKSTSPSDNSQAGHYTQMIYSSASRIGCGFSKCSNTTYDRYFVCYYGEMQTYYSRYEPYQDGKICSQCEKNCDNGLCDCGGAFCSNGGTMDLKTCTCTCPYSTFSGRYCENVICPKEDSPFCSHSLFEDKCWLYPVVRATCPYMCSLCTKYNDLNSQSSYNLTMPLNNNNNNNLKPRDLSAMEHFKDLVKSLTG